MRTRTITTDKELNSSWVNLAVLRRGEEHLLDSLLERDFPSYRGGPGEPYNRAPWVRRTDNFIFIRQDCGYDV